MRKKMYKAVVCVFGVLFGSIRRVLVTSSVFVILAIVRFVVFPYIVSPGIAWWHEKGACQIVVSVTADAKRAVFTPSTLEAKAGEWVLIETPNPDQGFYVDGSYESFTAPLYSERAFVGFKDEAGKTYTLADRLTAFRPEKSGKLTFMVRTSSPSMRVWTGRGMTADRLSEWRPGRVKILVRRSSRQPSYAELAKEVGSTGGKGSFLVPAWAQIKKVNPGFRLRVHAQDGAIQAREDLESGVCLWCHDGSQWPALAPKDEWQRAAHRLEETQQEISEILHRVVYGPEKRRF